MSDPNQTTNAWESQLLRRYRVRAIHSADVDGPCLPARVESESGNTYTVDREARIARDSGSMYFRWTCTCPARKTCRHIDAVSEWLYPQGVDYDDVEVMERTVN